MWKKIEIWYTKFLEERVIYYSTIYHFDMSPDGKTSYNNEGDAFKHCFMSAELSLWLGQKIAEWIGVKHEDDNPYNTPEERTMDLWNNEKGRGITKSIKTWTWLFHLPKIYTEIVESTVDQIHSGELICSIDDPRCKPNYIV